MTVWIRRQMLRGRNGTCALQGGFGHDRSCVGSLPLMAGLAFVAGLAFAAGLQSLFSHLWRCLCARPWGHLLSLWGIRRLGLGVVAFLNSSVKQFLIGLMC